MCQCHVVVKTNKEWNRHQYIYTIQEHVLDFMYYVTLHFTRKKKKRKTKDFNKRRTLCLFFYFFFLRKFI